ncbi:MAG: GNAT family N-acetyltransferase [Jiangellaceae bacterium]
MSDATVQLASFAELDAATLYALLKLRVDVFVVEQNCAYPELDGRDTEPGARHLWTSDATGPTSYLRILEEPDDVIRIGRVVVAGRARGSGAAGRLMDAALAYIGTRTAVHDAQSYLVDFYARYGFTKTGPEFLDDGIPHMPMARP